MRTNRYTEDDAIHANAFVPRQTASSTILGLGGQISHSLQFGGNWRVTPQLRAGIYIALNQDRRNLTVALADRLFLPKAYVSGRVGVRSQSGFRGGAGVRVARGQTSLLLDYDVRTLAQRGQNHALTISLAHAF